MSIEALIQAHTEALLANTEAVKLLTLSLAGRTPTGKVDKEAKAEKIVGKTADKVIVDEIAAAETVEESDAVIPASVPYETVRELVLSTAKAGKRDELGVVFKKHGISNLKVLLDKEDDFSTVNDHAKLEAVYADLQALEG